jgi:pilus assembly protein CpaE
MGMNKKILIVDDDLESLKLIGLMLQRRGYEILAATGGHQALVMAATQDPDLVVLDVLMPEMDGYEVCQRLRSNPGTANLPVLMFTAKTMAQDKAAGFRAGADDYLTKPIHPSKLVSHVEALLQRAEQMCASAKRAPRKRIIGVMGAKGGVGTSTLVVNLAAAAGQQGDQPRDRDNHRWVGVVDLRSGLGTVALLLGQPPRGGWEKLVRLGIENLDQETVESQLATHASGLRYLPASLQPESDGTALPPGYVEVVLNRLAENAYCLFLDLGSVLDQTTRHAIAHCDAIVVVVEPERLCLTLAQVLMEKIEALDAAPDDLRVVLVQRLKTDTAYSQQQVEDLLEHKLAGIVSPAAVIVREAFEWGQPAVLSHPAAEISEQIRDLSQALLA